MYIYVCVLGVYYIYISIHLFILQCMYFVFILCICDRCVSMCRHILIYRYYIYHICLYFISLCQSAFPSIHPSIHPSVCPSIPLPVCPSTHPSACPSVPLPVCPCAICVYTMYVFCVCIYILNCMYVVYVCRVYLYYIWYVYCYTHLSLHMCFLCILYVYPVCI